MHPADETWIIGCAEGCHPRITGDPYISAHHARITRTPDGTIWIEDLGSTNGTRLQRSPHDRTIGPATFPVTTPTPLLPGDTILIGHTRIPIPSQPPTGPHQ